MTWLKISRRGRESHNQMVLRALFGQAAPGQFEFVGSSDPVLFYIDERAKPGFMHIVYTKQGVGCCHIKQCSEVDNPTRVDCPSALFACLGEDFPTHLFSQEQTNNAKEWRTRVRLYSNQSNMKRAG